MSAGYASRLSAYPNKGVCGLPERRDTKRGLEVKLKQLAQMVKHAKHFVILTGAGISTSAGIPDFRGPKGIWTLEQQKEKTKKRKQRRARANSIGTSSNHDGNTSKRQKKDDGSCGTNNDDHDDDHDDDHNVASFDFAKARPTLTHRAIAALAEHDILQYCITQNVDGLHKRSGLSRDRHAVLHGCAFTEQCLKCKTEYFRDFDTGGMSFQPTGRKCEDAACDGNLHDTLLDWEDVLPEKDLDTSQDHCERADLVLCLGTSLRIEPAGSLPTYAKQYVIVNLQQTPKDEGASLIIRAPVDDVMTKLMDRLGICNWENGDGDDGHPYPIERTWKQP